MSADAAHRAQLEAMHRQYARGLSAEERHALFDEDRIDHEVPC